MQTLVFWCIFIQATVSNPVANTKRCQDTLLTETCLKLKSIAQIFNEKAELVDNAVEEALSKKISKLTDIIEYTKTYLIDRVKNFTCEDVLTTEQCSNLVKIATKFHGSVTDLARNIKEAVTDSIMQGKQLYQKAVEILLEKVKSLSCEQLIDAATCQNIKNFALKVHATSIDIKNAIIDAYSKGLSNAKDFFDDVVEYLTNEISCESVLSSLACSKLQYLADKFGTSFNTIVDFLRDSLVKGITNISDLYKSATTYIMKQWLGDEPENYNMVKRSTNEMNEDDFMKILHLIELHAKSKGRI